MTRKEFLGLVLVSPLLALFNKHIIEVDGEYWTYIESINPYWYIHIF